MQANRRVKQFNNRSKPPTDIKRMASKSPKIPTNTDIDSQMKSSIKDIANINDKKFYECVREENFEKALKVLHQVQAKIFETDFLERKDIYFEHLSIYYNNLAYVLSQLQQNQQCFLMFQRAIKNSDHIMLYLPTKQQTVSYLVEHVQLSMKYCALLSTRQQHNEAILVAETCLSKLSQCIKMLEVMCKYSVGNSRESIDTCNTECQSRRNLSNSKQKVNFKGILLKEASKLLSEVGEISSVEKLICNTQGQFQHKIKNLYFWQSNSSNNTTTIHKYISHSKNQQDRNILGLQKTSSFIEDFNLTDVMSMDLKKISQKRNIDKYFLLSAPKVTQIALLASVCYFTIATEMRFREGNVEFNSLKINEKYNKLHKDEKVKRCKILHLKAIELAGTFLGPSNGFFTHLINSYNKHYKCVMDQIKEQSEISIKSLKRSKEINQTYYVTEEDTIIDQSYLPTHQKNKNDGNRSIHKKSKKKRSVSKEQGLKTMKKKQRSTSGLKKKLNIK